jgi:hypothetical protein
MTLRVDEVRTRLDSAAQQIADLKTQNVKFVEIMKAHQGGDSLDWLVKAFEFVDEAEKVGNLADVIRTTEEIRQKVLETKELAATRKRMTAQLQKSIE